ncbi:hypothetical protein [Photobacterium sp. TY1-4]|uniref:hypothetical protein n=1 Tax=Photobacterium sp. TY1-4 TaxID=2899122 RepID=UPI0021C0FB10|nr:hypothetical protein [Photobacterium sp. TY1-4]UXI04498.1 hypothetical protein NH461_20650 [Photobacterium sp. TY1-4]
MAIMQSDFQSMPWDFEPTLNKSDVDVVMQQLTKACFELKDSINSKYDDAWTIGTKKYGWALNVIERMALSSKYPSITIGKSGLGQVFKINSVPVSIVTDDVHNPRKHRRYMPSEVEQEQLSLFEDSDLPRALVWRLILDMKVSISNANDLESLPKIKLIGLDDNKVVASYTYDDVVVPVVVNSPLREESVEQLPVQQAEPLLEESKAKPVKLVRRVRKNEEKESKGQ